jgi:hypothetical protein
MKLSARRGLECRILHHLSQSSGRKGCINMPATFQFSPATSKSIDIPDNNINFLVQGEITWSETLWNHFYEPMT